MPDPRPFLMPVFVMVGAVQHSGTYEVRRGALTVRCGAEEMTVELDGASPSKRAPEVLAALVKRARKHV